ncbi:Bifunctional inhibitor/lipid-transfer protein/seed storage 2S albumin superfamily protein [Raphanus sativus]|uniref:Non-specific lipid transfer protein GPI-anchored 10-like n=1 Tax=Raphanus sativus TaxID=3726 RepID=A0A9W3C1S2_RAPSA|nr:non-specific lipid transfer protein GPI-anchored 10-like [Raphanus sativus]KAJ4916105.1 Bifunctional inhibitor/lipid-transfer protein/seed storage 2S albumin superfamily protein [Raphanus sativus]
MASPSVFISVLISLVSVFLQPGLAQGQSPPASCASLLLALAPCGPFVQGFVQFPAQPCCSSLSQIYSQQPTCLCLFLNNNSTLSSAFPINQTLALQLPQLCSIPANSSVCSSDSPVSPAPANSTGSHVPMGAKNNSAPTATPVAQVAPKPSNMMGLSDGLRSSGPKFKIQVPIFVIAAILAGTLFLV